MSPRRCGSPNCSSASLLVLQAKYIRPEYFTSDFTLFPTWPVFDAERSLELFVLTMAVLLRPKPSA